MEVHPILECGDELSRGLWYVISSESAPQARVGMACVASNDARDHSSELYVFGGANPSCTFSDTYKLDLKLLKWSKLCGTGLRSRYEHFAYMPDSEPKSIYTFGGANESGNLDLMQMYDIKNDGWTDLSCVPEMPAPRTIHCAGYFDNKMYVYSGGYQGADPVSDEALHIFCSESKRWSKHALSGNLPSARHGHVMIILNAKLYIHGGMAGPAFYDDLSVVDFTRFKSVALKKNGHWPCARAGHYGSGYKNKFYIFGGMCLKGALDDMFSFDVTTLSWTLMKFDCPPPEPRLDHSMVCAMLPVKKHNTAGKEHSSNKVGKLTSQTKNPKPNIVPIDDWKITVEGGAESMENLDLGPSEVPPTDQDTILTLNGNVEYDFIPVCLIMGGMDTSGNIFNDVFVTRIDG